MALIKCTECEKEISDKAASCPNCGLVLNDAKPAIAEPQAPKRAELSEKKKSGCSGVSGIVMGIPMIIVGIFTVGLIFGIFLIIIGIVLVGLGVQGLKGVREGKCPYCENEVTVAGDEATFECPHCKKISNRRDEFLETIES